MIRRTRNHNGGSISASIADADTASTGRVVAALGIAGVGPAVVVVSAHLLDLPSVLAVSWQAGVPNAEVAPARLAGVVVAVGVLSVGVAGALLVLPRVPFLARRLAVVVAAAAAGAAAGLWGLFVITALSAADAESPTPPDIELLVPLLAVLVPTRLAGLAYGSPKNDPWPPPPAADLPRAALPAGEAPRWRHDQLSGFFLAAVLGLLLVGALVFRESTVAGLICWVAALLTIVMVRLRIELDDQGFSMSAWGRTPAMVLPWDRIVEAHAVRIRPVQWSGWGFLRVIPARSVLVLRKGPGLVLTLTDGRRLGVTLDDPVLPAGLVNSHLDRRREPS